LTRQERRGKIAIGVEPMRKLILLLATLACCSMALFSCASKKGQTVSFKGNNPTNLDQQIANMEAQIQQLRQKRQEISTQSINTKLSQVQDFQKKLEDSIVSVEKLIQDLDVAAQRDYIQRVSTIFQELQQFVVSQNATLQRMTEHDNSTSPRQIQGYGN
jgi:3-oxoacyl-ACP reductase-like protein